MGPEPGGIVDLHAHILPGLDDGPATIADSIALLRLLQEDGVGIVVATPHVAPGFFWPYEPRVMAAKLDELRAAAQVAGLTITIESGAELYLSPELVGLAGEGRLPVIGGSPFLLVELSRREVPLWTFEVLVKLQRAGFRPILAHPELYPHLWEDENLPADLVEQGILLQVDAASITGRFGRAAADHARELVCRGFAHVVASDVHSVQKRPPEMTTACDLVRRGFGESVARRLFCETPKAILSGAGGTGTTLVTGQGDV